VDAGIRQLAASGEEVKAVQNQVAKTKRMSGGSCANNLSNGVSKTTEVGNHESLPGFFDVYGISKQCAKTDKHSRSISVQVFPLALSKAVEIVAVSRGGNK
jgi:hypothetical protein